jgi:hypothetical protein
VRAALFACFFVFVVCVACGGDEQAATPAGAPTQGSEGAQPGQPPREETTAALKAQFEWGGSGPPRDLDADFESCDPAKQGGTPRPGLAGFAEGVRCLEAKGWKIKPKQE